MNEWREKILHHIVQLTDLMQGFMWRGVDGDQPKEKRALPGTKMGQVGLPNEIIACRVGEDHRLVEQNRFARVEVKSIPLLKGLIIVLQTRTDTAGESIPKPVVVVDDAGKRSRHRIRFNSKHHPCSVGLSLNIVLLHPNKNRSGVMRQFYVFSSIPLLRCFESPPGKYERASW